METEVLHHETSCPYNMIESPFARRSVTIRNSRTESKSQREQSTRNIIVGGSQRKQTSFYEILFVKESDRRRIPIFKSFEKDLDDKNANLSKMGINRKYGGQLACSHLTNDERHIVVLDRSVGYNVYDMANDKWLLSTNNKAIINSTGFARSLLIDDEIFVVSERNCVYFYSIKNEKLKCPQLIKKYQFSDKRLSYFAHGMCCIGGTCSYDQDKKCNYKQWKILLFGNSTGEIQISFFESFLLLNVEMDVDNNMMRIKRIEEELINFEMDNKSKWINIDPQHEIFDNFLDFGYECIINSKGEAVIIIIGGRHLYIYPAAGDYAYYDRSIIQCNLNTRQVKRKANVCNKIRIIHNIYTT